MYEIFHTEGTVNLFLKIYLAAFSVKKVAAMLFAIAEYYLADTMMSYMLYQRQGDERNAVPVYS